MEKTLLGEAVEFPARARPKAVIHGTRVAPYHPLGNVGSAFRAIFGGDFEVDLMEDAGEFSPGLAGVRLVIGYADIWDGAMSDASAAGLTDFVSRGGGLLVLHNGICWAKNARVLPLVGAAFAGHPEQAVMPYRLEGTHPIIAGLGGFELREEPYRYEFVPDFSGDVFLRYEYQARAWEAGWAQSYGAGRVVHLQPGHVSAAFEHPSYAALVRRSALWCAGMI